MLSLVGSRILTGRRIIGSVIVCAAQDIGMLVAGRFINGICVGIASAQVPVYISELAPPAKRGLLVGVQQWAITWGILIMFYVSYVSFVLGYLGYFSTSSDLIRAVTTLAEALRSGFLGDCKYAFMGKHLEVSKLTSDR